MKSYFILFLILFLSIPLCSIDYDNWQEYQKKLEKKEKRESLIGLGFALCILGYSVALVTKKI